MANFGSGTVSVLDATTLAPWPPSAWARAASPPSSAILRAYQRVFVANHHTNTIAVINTVTNTVEKFVTVPDKGAWGLAVNDRLNQVYVSFRESATLVTLDAGSNWEPLTGQTIQPCGGQPAAPYGLAFDSGPMKLFVACAPAGNVNTAVVYQAGNGGLVELKRVALPSGGPNGGRVAVNVASNNAFFTNSSSNSVSIIGHPSNQVIGPRPSAATPFAVAVDFVGGRVIIGNRGR